MHHPRRPRRLRHLRGRPEHVACAERRAAPPLSKRRRYRGGAWLGGRAGRGHSWVGGTLWDSEGGAPAAGEQGRVTECSALALPSPRGAECQRSSRPMTLVFPVLIRGGKATPLFSFAGAVLFCTMNGYLQSRYLSQFAVYAEDWVASPCFLTGFALWLIGMVINVHSDHILRNLRKPGETGYKIPRGGLFEYVSAANYFGEIMEWCGFALASWSLQATVFALFTFSTLFTRARQHHQWYHEKFEDYPKSRKMLIPFVL
ncbi:3-oxo-5-alpha-steroid 4-dehydrogenase 1 isoform X2 [Peromyscus californicus insignis]|uniref:3-oxo-5-alpha-steroid 4-dehydrogenase 1 isoform X2 n=1 Tax=Peromyscus californicus insignis TaxID=564181 RepID=UPI0022A7A083|nr:3-oxo-5-alpha-steroid 4-dehydrogenase 1 isoform X2 [Peromyscus californicus insignis]